MLTKLIRNIKMLTKKVFKERHHKNNYLGLVILHAISHFVDSEKVIIKISHFAEFEQAIIKISHLAAFEQVIIKISPFADCEQVKKTNSTTPVGETGCLCIFLFWPHKVL